jgi:hypothetical protein
MHYDFLVETYETERIKVVSTWSEFRDEEMPLRPRTGDPRGRSVHEQMVHQCKRGSLDAPMQVPANAPPLPKPETRLEFIRRLWRTAARGMYCAPKTKRGGRGDQIFRRAASRAWVILPIAHRASRTTGSVLNVRPRSAQ